MTRRAIRSANNSCAKKNRLLPDGTRQKTTTVYESDVNGRMNAVERSRRENQEGRRCDAVHHRRGASGHQQAFSGLRTSGVRADAAGRGHGRIEKSSRKVDNGLGGMVEVERTESAMSRSGDTATTETKVWKRSVVNADRLELAGRTVGKLVENPDGSSEEVVEVYASSSGGGASNLNATGDHDLQQRIQRETRKTADGGTIESTTTQSRSVADPRRFGAKEVQRRVRRPTAGGETVETHSYEEGVNGKLRPIGSTVEQIEKK